MAENIFELSKAFHKKYGGKIALHSKVPLETQEELSLAYTPGVAAPCEEIHKHPEAVYTYTSLGNLIAVVTDGSAVLGLGDIGPQASLPVMEGKAILFKKFGNLDAFPICIDTQDPDEFVHIVEKIAPSFGGINLEDIAAPRCFEIEAKLKERLDIPVFHDDQHGTAIVVVAALINALKVVDKKMEDIRVALNGAGAAGTAIAYFLLSFGIKDIILCDRQGTIYEGRTEGMNPHKQKIAETTNREKVRGSLKDAMRDSDLFIGVSSPNVVDEEMIKVMAPDPIICPLANPIPEIMPDKALAAGAAIVCTGRSDFANQVNNVLVFPGIFRGALNAHSTTINEEMKRAAATALASVIPENELRADYVIPQLFNAKISTVIADAVAEAARSSGVTKKATARVPS